MKKLLIGVIASSLLITGVGFAKTDANQKNVLETIKVKGDFTTVSPGLLGLTSNNKIKKTFNAELFLVPLQNTQGNILNSPMGGKGVPVRLLLNGDKLSIVGEPRIRISGLKGEKVAALLTIKGGSKFASTNTVDLSSGTTSKTFSFVPKVGDLKANQ